MKKWQKTSFDTYERLFVKDRSLCCARVTPGGLAKFALIENGSVVTVQYDTVEEAKKDIEEVMALYWELDDE